MTVQGRDVIFTFDNSCNSKCCLWSRCCPREMEDQDPVYVSPRGQVKHFDFKHRDSGAKRTISNIHRLLSDASEDRQKMQAVLVAIQDRLQISLEDQPSPAVMNASQIKAIEQIALPILRAPSPKPIMLQRSHKSRELDVPPPSPAHLSDGEELAGFEMVE